VRLTSRRNDDADVIRARLRALLNEGAGRSGSQGGWLPDDDPDEDGDPPEPPAGAGWPDPAGATGPEQLDEGLPRGIGRHRSPGQAVRWDPGRGGARSLWVAGVLAALVLIVWTWLDRPQVERVPDDPVGAAQPVVVSAEPPAPPVGEVAETSATVVVSVVGLVARPGLVTLPSGSRVADAVDAAGGLLPDADPAGLNLAAVVSDGQQVAVGVPGAGPPASPGAGGAAPPGAGGPLNLNTATVAELDGLPGIGPVLAQRIADYRTAQGPFTSTDQLDDVPGIGPSIAAELAELVTV
jgi:competence protein ComEA